MPVTGFVAFASGSACATFIDSVPMIEIAWATSKVEMAPAVLPARRKCLPSKEWENAFMKKFEVPLDSEVGLPKMIGAFCVMAQCELDVEGVGFVPPSGGAGAAGTQITG